MKLWRKKDKPHRFDHSGHGALCYCDDNPRTRVLLMEHRLDLAQLGEHGSLNGDWCPLCRAYEWGRLGMDRPGFWWSPIYESKEAFRRGQLAREAVRT